MAVIVFAAMSVALVLRRRQPPVERATAWLLVTRTRPEEAGPARPFPEAEHRRAIHTYQAMVQRPPVMEGALARMPQDVRGRLRKGELRLDISAANPPGSDMIEVSVDSTDPFAPARMVDALCARLLERSDQLNQQHRARRLQALALQAATVERELAEAAAASLRGGPKADMARVRREELLREYKRLVNEEVAVARGDTDPLPQLTLVRRAYTARSPRTPPRTLYRLLLGMAIGFIVAVAVAAWVEALDDRIHGRDQVAALVDAPVLGVVPHGYRLGAAMALSKRGPPGAGEWFRGARNQLALLGGGRLPGRLGVLGIEGGEGATVVALGLGIALARGGLRVALLDADFRQSGLGRMVSLKHGSGLGDVLAGQATVKEMVQTTPWNGLNVMAAGLRPDDPSQALASDDFRRILAEVAAIADIVLVDGPPCARWVDGAHIAQAMEATVLVVGLGHTTRRGLEAALAQLQLSGGRLLGLVLNKARGWEARQSVRG
jgi:capsular exopolysaccharide synthesis family protein